MSSIFDWLAWVYDAATTADEIRASWNALQRANLNNPPYRKAMAMNPRAYLHTLLDQIHDNDLIEVEARLNELIELRIERDNYIPSPQPTVTTKRLHIDATYIKPPSIVIEDESETP